MPSLYNTYRPLYILDMLGDKQFLGSVNRRAVKYKQPSTILITGNSGCGKTTMARAYSREVLKTENLESCKYYYEFNVGSESGVDNIRNILDMLQYKSDKKRVFVLDEIHALSKQAFSALLKPLEEPSENVLWILVTNKPETLKPEIVNRSIKINMVPPDDGQIFSFISKIVKKEKIRVSKDLLYKIQSACAGDLRETLSTLDALSSYKSIDDKVVSYVIRNSGFVVDNEYLVDSIKVLTFIYTANAPAYIDFIVNYRKDYTILLHNMISSNSDILNYMANVRLNKPVDGFKPWIVSLLKKVKETNHKTSIKKSLHYMDALHKSYRDVCNPSVYSLPSSVWGKECLLVALHSIIRE